MNIRENFNLAEITWFKVGGFAKYFVRPSNNEELKYIIQKYSNYIILGNTSNVLISEKGLPECFIKLGAKFGKITQISETKFQVGASCLDSTLAKTMQNEGISGMEFLCTIPGTIGGNIMMNAGCFGGEIFDILESVEIMQENGEIITLLKNEISYAYRHAVLPKNSIILSAILKGVKSDSVKIQQTMDLYTQKRLESQPVNVRTGGSTFKNPNNARAWELIRNADAHILKIGGAQVSEKHANFLINVGNATAQEIYTLGNLIQKKVLEHSGIMLEWEIKKIGYFE